jgi:Flp pilus assembly CpaF family ATPase
MGCSLSMSEKIPFEDITISNLVDPEINTMSRQVAQYLIENIHEGKNIIITGASETGRTLLLNVLGKHVSLKNKIMCMAIKQELMFYDHTTEYLVVENFPLNTRTQEYFYITKGFPYYEEYQTFIFDDLPKTSFINFYNLLLTKKQVLAVISDESNDRVIHNLLNTLSNTLGEEHLQNIGVNLLENIDIIIHVRRYSDGYIRIKEIVETEFYNSETKNIISKKIFEYSTENKINSTGKLIGDFIKLNI